MSQLLTLFQNTQERIHDALLKAGRKDSVQLLAISKYHPVEKIEALFKLGHKDFGESYVQEAEQKIKQLKDLDICWHFVGPIQSNKTRLIASLFDWVHSVDRLKIARRLNDHCVELDKRLNICLQINLNKEPQKGGFMAEELKPVIDELKNLSSLNIRGLMAIPEKTDDYKRQRENFALLRHLKDQLNRQYSMSMDTLSMGMSNDLEAAIAEGTTVVRVGTALFGART